MVVMAQMVIVSAYKQGYYIHTRINEFIVNQQRGGEKK